MEKKNIKDKNAEKKSTKKGFDEMREALMRSIKEILDSIARNFVLNIEISCKIAGVGSIATFEYQKDDIPSEEHLEEENTDKLEGVFKKLLSKAKDRIIEALKSKNLGTFEFSAGTESIQAISWLTDVNFKVTINLQ